MNLCKNKLSLNLKMLSFGVFGFKRSPFIHMPLTFCCSLISTKESINQVIVVPRFRNQLQQINKRHFSHRLIPLQTDTLLFYNKYCILNFSRNLPEITFVRFYSEDNNEKGESEKKIQNDPWIKSIMDDIKQDFAATTTNIHSENPIGCNTVTAENVNASSDEHDHLPSLSYEEYDYRYADEKDEIEEFGYYDEHEIRGQTPSEKVLPISLKRSDNGVFELEELVTLMEHLGAENIVSVLVPPEANYCDHMVLVTAKSNRHLRALNEEMLWVHKRKKYRKDPVLHIEGFNKSDWCAMDLGNLVLHIFGNEETRQFYDIESLWLLGPDNDPKCQEEDETSFALSPEDLFWLEASGSKDPKTNETQDKPNNHDTVSK